MKTVVNGFAASVRRLPWVVIAGTIVISVVLGGFAGQFVPAEDQNESFAPEAPELTAQAEIGALFGSTTRMQILMRSDDGDVITLAALQAAIALDEAIRSEVPAELLADSPQAPAVLTHMAPVQLALQSGAPMPASDLEVKNLYLTGLEQTPPQGQGFLRALVSDDADLTTGTAELGLSVVTYQASDDFDLLAERARLIADAAAIASVPESITVEPFSVELIFASGDDFQEEILRLFASAGLIILLVLAIVFLVRPKNGRDRLLYAIGAVLMLLGIAVAIAPSLALIFPDVFPESWGTAEFGPLLLTSAILYVAAFLIWTVGSARLRRTTADTLLTFLTIGLAIQWMNGYGYLRFEDQSQLVQVLPILLIGLGVDYSIHMTTRYRQEIHEGVPVDLSVTTAIRTVGIALVLATLTTAVGFLTNVTNDIPALAEFGELAAVGIVASFLLMLTFVPAVRLLLDRRAESSDRLDTEVLEAGESRALPRLIGKTAALPSRFASLTVIASLLLAGVGAYGMTGLETKFSFLDFVPTTSPLRDTAVTVDNRFDFPETTSVLAKGDVASGASWNAMVAAYANAAGVEDVQTVQTQSGETFATGTSLTLVMLQLLNPAGETFDQEVLEEAVALGLGSDRTVPDDGDLTSLYDLAAQNHPDLMSAVLARDDRGYSAALFNFDTTGGESGASDLALGLNDAFEPARSAGLEAVATSNFIINDLVVTTLRDSQVSSLLLTMGAALLLLVINFWFESRRPMLGVITTIPVVFVVVWVFGLMALFRIAFGPVTATISAIGIGIGIPYMIHVTHRFLEERIEQVDSDAAIEHTLTHTGGALAGSAITTMAGFGILMISTTIPFRQFGFVIAYTILLALAAAVLVLPSMLALWDRWHRSRGEDPVEQRVLEAALQETS